MGNFRWHLISILAGVQISRLLRKPVATFTAQVTLNSSRTRLSVSSLGVSLAATLKAVYPFFVPICVNLLVRFFRGLKKKGLRGIGNCGLKNGLDKGEN